MPVALGRVGGSASVEANDFRSRNSIAGEENAASCEGCQGELHLLGVAVSFLLNQKLWVGVRRTEFWILSDL